jgi:ubiquinone/menaquinone biosynthesis C-methylase UbiE
MSMGKLHKHYIPAAGHNFLLPLYDPLLRLLGRQERTHGRLVELADIRTGQSVLEIGCGTGALAVLVKRRYPETRIVGLDPDPKALDRARTKAERAGLKIEWQQGFADTLPFADGSFDRVLSSLMLHHLTMSEKQRALDEVRRVLVPGGTLHVLDFGRPGGALDRTLTFLIHHGERMADNLEGRLPELMRGAGLAEVCEFESVRTAFGRLSLFAARRE